MTAVRHSNKLLRQGVLISLMAVQLFCLIAIPDLEATEVRELAVASAGLVLQAWEVPRNIHPGEQYSFTVSIGQAAGGWLHYTVDGIDWPQRLKLVVYAETAIPDGALSVEILDFPGSTASGDYGTAISGAVSVGSNPDSPGTLIYHIGNCDTGNGTADGPLLRYTLTGNPGFSSGDIVIRYALTEELP
jgi:hypothetical protein